MLFNVQLLLCLDSCIVQCRSSLFYLFACTSLSFALCYDMWFCLLQQMSSRFLGMQFSATLPVLNSISALLQLNDLGVVYVILWGRVALGAQRPIAIKLSHGRSVDLWVFPCVCSSVCPVHSGKMADRIRMSFGIISRTGPGMRQVVGFGNRSTGRGTFGGMFWVRHCNQWGLIFAPKPLPKLLWADLLF